MAKKHSKVNKVNRKEHAELISRSRKNCKRSQKLIHRSRNTITVTHFFLEAFKEARLYCNRETRTHGKSAPASGDEPVAERIFILCHNKGNCKTCLFGRTASNE